MKRAGGTVVIAALLLAVLFTNAGPAGAVADPAPAYVWAKVLSSDGNASAADVAVDPSGNAYVIGGFRGTLDLNPGAGTFPVTSNGQNDIFIAKYNSNGGFVWGGAIGGPGDDDPGAVALDGAGGLYFGGTFNGTVDFDISPAVDNLTSVGDDGFVMRFDTSGNLAWVVAQGDSVVDLDASTTGRVNATGELTSLFDFDPGPGTTELSVADGAVWVSELAAGGGHAWAVNYEGQRVTSLAVDTGGNVYTAGTHQNNADMDPGPGAFTLPATGFTDMYISKLNSNGAFVWARNFGGTESDGVSDIAVTPSAVYATGSFAGTVDFDPGAGITSLTPPDTWPDAYVLKWTSGGNFVWVAAPYSPGPNDLGTGVAIDSEGNLVATGYFTNEGDFDPGPGTFELTNDYGLDLYAWKLSTIGAFIWAGAAGGEQSSAEQARTGEVALDGAGNPTIVGRVTAVDDFDFDPQTGTVFIPASEDPFLLRLDGAARCNGLAVTIDMNANGGIGAGTAGDDVIFGTPGNDSIRAGAGDDTVCAGSGSDRIVGGPGSDTIFGDDGPDTIRGSGGGDVIDGGAGGDTISGQGGADVIHGGGGPDTINGQGAGDTLDGGTGDDTINGQNGADDITGDIGDDLLRGQIGPDAFRGDAGDDDMFGGEGADVFFGGPGIDKCSGNTGPDMAEASTCEQTPGIETLF